MVIFEDTRQQAGKHGNVHRYCEKHGIRIVRTKLAVGDYMLAGPGGGGVSVDTKTLGVAELASNCFQEHDRFRAECVLAKDCGIRLIVLVEEQLPDANLQVIGEIGVGVMELQAGNIEALAVAMGNGKQIVANNPDLVICDWQFDVKAEYEANVVMMHKGETELLAAVNAALAKAYAAGYYGQWYQEALDLAAAEGAIEQSYDDAGQVIAG